MSIEHDLDTHGALQRKTALDGDHVRTLPVSPAVDEAFNAWLAKHYAEMVALLQPFGLHPYELSAPKLTRVVFQDELSEVGV